MSVFFDKSKSQKATVTQAIGNTTVQPNAILQVGKQRTTADKEAEGSSGDKGESKTVKNALIAGTVSSTSKQNTNAVKTSLGWLAGNISDADFFGNKLCVKKNVTFDEYESVAYMPKKLSRENESLETEKSENVETDVKNVHVDKNTHTIRGKCAVRKNGGSDQVVRYQRGGNFYMPIIFGGQKVEAQFDSGAQCTICSPELYMSLKKKPKLDFDITLKGYQPGTQKGKFLEDVTFQIGNYEFDFPPAMGASNCPLLIGVDFLRTFNIDMSVTGSALKFGDEIFPLKYTGDDIDKFEPYHICNVKLDRNITIAPHTGRNISVDCKFNNTGLLWFEADQYENAQMSNSVIHPDGKLSVTICNFTDEKARLKKGTHLGMVTECNKLTIEEDQEAALRQEVPSTDCTIPEINKVDIKVDVPIVIPKEIHSKTPMEHFRLRTGKESEMNKLWGEMEPPKKFEIPLHFSKLFKEKYSESFPATEAVAFPQLLSEIPEHCRDMFSRSCKHISLHQAARFADTVVFFKDTFSVGSWDLGLCKIVEHTIDTGNSHPVKQQVRRTPIHFEDEEFETLMTMLQAGVIQPSSSEWASPVTLVKKKDGSLRWTVDMRILNKLTRKDSFPLPRIDECIQALQGRTYFCAMDAASGYWQVPLEAEARAKTAFICKYGLFEHLRLAQGLCNAPATYQRLMTQVMRNLQWVKAVIFLDDCLSFGDTFIETLDNTEEVLSRFKHANLKLKPKKCFFFQLEIVFLGRVINAEGISLQPDHLEIIKNWPVPKNIKQLEQWLGFANYHRNHLKNMAEMSDPLYKMISDAKQKTKHDRGKKAYQKVTAVWADETLKCFEKIRTGLINAPVLPIPDPEKTFLVDVDASGTHLGAELQQLDNGEMRVVQYGSRTLKPSQRNYCPSKREMLGAVVFLRLWRHFLIGKTFLLRTDSAALTFLMTLKNHDSNMGRWVVEMDQYSLILVHRKGSEHINADFISRPPEDPLCKYFREDMDLKSLPCHKIGPNGESIVCPKCKKVKTEWSDFDENVDDTLPLAGVIKAVNVEFPDINPNPTYAVSIPGKSVDEIKNSQLADYEFGTLIEWLNSQKGPSEGERTLCSPALRHYWSVRDQFTFISGVLYFRWVDMNECKFLLCVPESMRDEVLFYCHDSFFEGHPGEEPTISELKRRFYWRGMRTDAEIYVRNCTECLTCKYKKRKLKGKMVSRHAGYPNQRVHIDLIGPLTKSSSGNTAILMIIDQFTKFVEAIPVKDQKGPTIAKAFIEIWCAHFGVPNELHSDNGKSFIEGVFREATTRLQIQHSSTVVYHPAGNGAIERQNLTLMSKLRTILRRTTDFKNWDEYVPYCAAAIRATPNRMTKYTPNFLFFGRELNQPVDLMFDGPKPKADLTLSEYVKEMVKIIKFAYRNARRYLKISQKRAKRDHDRASYGPNISTGDIVYLRDTKRRKHNLSAKLLPLFKGPMLVIAKLNPVVFLLQYKKKTFTEHYDKIIAAKNEYFPPWILKLRRKLFKGPRVLRNKNRNLVGNPISEIRDLFGADNLNDKSLLEDHKVARKGRKGKLKITLTKKAGQWTSSRNARKYQVRKPRKAKVLGVEFEDQVGDPFLDFDGPSSTPVAKEAVNTDIVEKIPCVRDDANTNRRQTNLEANSNAAYDYSNQENCQQADQGESSVRKSRSGRTLKANEKYKDYV